MPFQILCGGCQRKLRIADSLVGKTIKCPQCARTMVLRTRQPQANGASNGTSLAPDGNVKPMPAKPTTAPSKKTPQTKLTPSSLDDTQIPRSPTTKAAPGGKKAAPPKKTERPAPKPIPKPARYPASTSGVSPTPTPVTRLLIPFRPPVPKKGADARKPFPTKLLIGGSAAIALILVGCFFFGGSTLGYVSGTVTLDGTPLGQAKVDFWGEGGTSGPFTAKTGDDGRYSIRSNTNTGIPVGKYKVTVSKIALPDDTLPDPEEFGKAVQSGILRNIVNDIYKEAQRTPLAVDVSAGSNRHNFTVTKQP